MTLAQTLERLPREATVPVGWVLDQLRLEAPAGVRWVESSRACDVMGCDAREIRRRAVRWERQQSRGQRPAVHVCRKSQAPESHWLFDEDDLFRLRREKGAVVLEKPELPDVEEAVDRILARDFG